MKVYLITVLVVACVSCGGAERELIDAGSPPGDDLSADVTYQGDAPAGSEIAPGADLLPGPVADEELPEAFLEQQIAWEECPLYEAYEGEGMAECASLTVPLYYDDIGGEQGKVQVKRLPALEPATRQLYILQGGPGLSGTATMGGLMAKVQEAAPDIEVITIDHRGTGGSMVLRCPDQEAEDSPSGTAIALDEWEACATYAEQTHPLDAITASNSARDLAIMVELLRQEELSVFVYGVSYGSFWAHRYARIFPNQADGVILDSLIPPTGFRNDIHDQVENDVTHAIFELCDGDEACFSLTGGNTWELANLAFQAFKNGDLCPDLATMGISYTSLQYLTNQLGLWYWLGRGLMPSIFHRLARCSPEDVVTLYNLAVTVLAPRSSVLMSEHYSSVAGRHLMLSELAFFPDDSLTLEEISAYEEELLSSRYLAYSNALHNDLWPTYPTDKYWGEWAPTSVPLLVLHGELDYMTPYAELGEMPDNFTGPNQHIAIFPTVRHGAFMESPVDTDYEDHCGFEIVMEWLADPSSPPNTSCVADVLDIDFAGDPEYVEAFTGLPDAYADDQMVLGCPIPDGLLDPTLPSRLVFSFVGKIGSFEDGLSLGLPDFDFTLHEEETETAQLAYGVENLANGVEWIFIQTVGQQESISEGHVKYLFSRVILRKSHLSDLKASGETILPVDKSGPGQNVFYNLSDVEQKNDATKSCPIAVATPDDPFSALHFCFKGDEAPGFGGWLRVAGHITVTDDPKAIEKGGWDGGECACYQGSGYISCDDFDAM
jgi:pimeloyl-ACP methyl ester carboxylesterase